MITLKKWNGDSEVLEDLYRHVNQEGCLVRIPVPMPEDSTERYLKAAEEGVVDGKEFLCFGIWLDDILIGKTDISRYPDRRAETDIVLRSEYTGRGYGTEALKQLLFEVWQTRWCDSVHAYIRSQNYAAHRAFEKAGFGRTRPFSADVMVNEDGVYRVEQIRGVEYAVHMRSA